MVVDAGGTLPLPWLADPLAAALATHRGHALLVHGAPGVGALSFALVLAQAWLCEGEGGGARPCGCCGSCRLVQSRVHPDLLVLLPETLRRAHDWPLAGDREEDDGKRKPSRQIRIDEVRALIDWATRTSARGRGKVAVLHPAEALNLQSANALLKTLEEPPAGTRLVLTAGDPALLLPTVRSRCQRLPLPAPPAGAAAAWLAAQGLARPEVLLAACSGRPLDALALAQAGIDAAVWSALPAAVARGESGVLAGWPVPQAVDALQKLCHDAMARASGAPAVYFPTERVPAEGAWPALTGWSQELARIARHEDHPWQEALMIDALVIQGRLALAPPAPAPPPRRGFATLAR
ncbi:MAG: DNA polymerase III subunit delta' [Rubrivivax sp.]|nr:DNA polymerase III subunit delta' [Betaproteobacteria bacterium]MBP6316710.1 DNA polymerase III subunit delta' [Rubrivivax sp.]MBK7275453.1 DNA polymerase III subunit delta' [Betaproteobacteria bacterium]MBK7458964.1 DNA polymerase III subunit delta' [Betaproteobacteria bacterium]MBK7514639.1 DNA polymerase III subunit delta' [Betaproteobacteria bacterium]